ncbi:hypothetical protein BH20ACI1_BH20ACI1_21870 [soil metagenome]
MIYTETQTNFFTPLQIPFKQIILGFVFILAAVFTIYAQTNISLSPDGKTLTVEEAKDNEIYAFGKTVIVKKDAKGILVFGGDVIIEGRVEGDVAAIGGNIIQEENAFIGGDVIVFGGTYRAKSEQPLRIEGKETVMIAMFEDELRDFSQNPAQIFSPSFSWSFLAQRILSILFWFIISLVFTTIAPGAVSRAITRFQLSTLKVIALGFAGFVVTTVGVISGLSFLPNYLSAIISLMAFVLLMLGYVFGRVALQVSLGKRLQKRFLPENKQSETLAILIGVVVWTIFLSIPFVWTFALLILLSASLGLVLTARSTNVWKKA